MEFKPLFQFLCFSHLLLLISGAIRGQEERNADGEVLISFRTGLQNPHLLSSWNQKIHYCKWDGVTCQLGRVAMLALPSRSLKGPLPPSLSALSSLIVLDLSTNFLFGQIPSELAELTLLETLKLGSNFLTGKIPPELGSLEALRKLDLSTNALSGTVPSELGHLTQLEFLDLGNNFLSRYLPSTLFRNLQFVTSLDISNNSFSGYISPEIGDQDSYKSNFDCEGRRREGSASE